MYYTHPPHSDRPTPILRTTIVPEKSFDLLDMCAHEVGGTFV
jgi:hypothetical protein